MRTVTIFVASSIIELKKERTELLAFESELREIYAKRKVDIHFTMCENMSQVLSASRKQDEYNEQIKNSNYFTILVGDNVGTYTREEFDVALQQFRHTKQYPRITTYFKKTKNKSESVQSFIEYLNKENQHYESYFSHIDTIKLNIVLELNRHPETSLNVSLSDAQVVSPFGVFTSIDIKNVPIYANNKNINELRAKKEAATQRFAEAKRKYDQTKQDEDFMVLMNCCNERDTVSKELEEAEKSLIKAVSNIIALSADGNMTERHEKALRFYNEGDIENALLVLNEEELDKDFERAETVVDTGIEAIKRLVKQCLFTIETYLSGKKTTETMNKVLSLYAKAHKRSVEYNLDRDYLPDYIYQLRYMRQYKVALTLCQDSYTYFQTCTNEALKANFTNSFSLICCDMNLLQNSEKLLKESLDIYRKLADENPEAYLSYVSLSCNNLGDLYRTLGRYEDSEKLLKESLDIYRRLADENPDAYLSYVALSCNNLGNLYKTLGRYEDSEKLYKESLDIYRKLAEENPEAYLSDVASSCNNLGLLYNTLGRYEDSEKLHKESLNIYRELADENPDAYLSDVATSCNNLGGLYNTLGRYEDSEKLYKESLDMYRKLAEENPDAYLSYVAFSCNSLGDLYQRLGRYEDSEKLLKETLDILKRLAEKNPEAYLSDVARSCNDLGCLYYTLGRYEDSEKLLKESLDIRRKLSDEIPEVYLSCVALSCGNLGNLYNTLGRYEDSEKLLKESLDIYRELADENPDAYLSDVALSCNNLGDLYRTLGRYEDSEKLHKESLDIRRKLAEENPEVYLSDVATSCNNLGCLYKTLGRYEDSEKLLKESLDINRKLAEENPEVFLPDVTRSCEKLGELYQTMGKPEESEKYFAERDALLKNDTD